MNVEKWNGRLTLLANVGVVVGLVFLAMEIRTNTETNHIAIFQNYSANWMHMHAQMAENRELAALVEKAYSGGELNNVESRQFRGWTFQRVSQSSQMLRLYDGGLISEYEAKRAFRAIRGEALHARFRQEIETISNSRFKSLILDKDGLEKHLNFPELGRH